MDADAAKEWIKNTKPTPAPLIKLLLPILATTPLTGKPHYAVRFANYYLAAPERSWGLLMLLPNSIPDERGTQFLNNTLRKQSNHNILILASMSNISEADIF